jgi:tetratricopeptide (TPR) repeat protein
MVAEMLVGLARHSEAEQSYRQASDVLEKLAADWPAATEHTKSLALCQTNLGLVLRNMERHEEAEQVLRRAVDLHAKLVAEFPRDTRAHSALAVTRDSLAVVLAAIGRLDDAEQLLRESVAAQEKLIVDYPDVPDFRSRLGFSLFNLAEFLDHRLNRLSEARQRMDQAVAHQREALRQHPQHIRYREALKNHYWGLTDILVRLGEHAAAVSAMEELPRLSAEDSQGCRRAADYLARCVRLAENDAQLAAEERKMLARAYEDRCRTMLREALAKSADNPAAQNDLAWFLATCPDARFRDGSQAAALGQRAVEQAPENGGYWNTLGVAHYRTGDWRAAIQAVEKSIALTKDGNGVDRFILAMAHWQLGDKQQARHCYDQAVQWMEKNKPADEELAQFRAEAAALLGLNEPPGPPAEDGLPERRTCESC